MKWYKHISDSLDDPFIFGLIKDFGGDGYLTFFGVLEIYSREFRTEPGWKLIVTESYLKQKLYKRQGTVIIKCLKYIATNGKLPANSQQTRDKLPANSQQTRDKLPANSRETFQNSGKWDVEFNGEEITIYIPKFRELLDESTLKKLRENERSFRKASGIIPISEPTDKEEEDRDIEKEKEKKKKFSPPSIKDISDYCKERQNEVDPVRFFNFYAAKDWMIGKNKMQDWRAAVITWERRDKTDERKEACEL